MWSERPFASSISDCINQVMLMSHWPKSVSGPHDRPCFVPHHANLATASRPVAAK